MKIRCCGSSQGRDKSPQGVSLAPLPSIPNPSKFRAVTAEQQAQRRATATRKLSKRISGNLKAKDELREALATWIGMMGQHLVGLAQRVQALGQKVDEGLSACNEMQLVLQEQPSQAKPYNVRRLKP